VFEDGAPGVVAANRAGMPVIWVPDANLLEHMSSREDATLRPSQTLASLLNFQPEEWHLPPFAQENQAA